GDRRERRRAGCEMTPRERAEAIADEQLANWPCAVQGVLRTAIRNDLLIPAIVAARDSKVTPEPLAVKVNARERAEALLMAIYSISGLPTNADHVGIIESHIAAAVEDAYANAAKIALDTDIEIVGSGYLQVDDARATLRSAAAAIRDRAKEPR